MYLSNFSYPVCKHSILNSSNATTWSASETGRKLSVNRGLVSEMKKAEFLRKFMFIAIDTKVLIAVLADETLADRITPIIDAVTNKLTHSVIVSALTFSE